MAVPNFCIKAFNVCFFHYLLENSFSSLLTEYLLHSSAPIPKDQPTEENGPGPGVGKLPKFGDPLKISATAEASEFTFGMQLGFSKAHHKITPRGKVGVGVALG